MTTTGGVKPTCKTEGCKRSTRSRGLCRACYERFRLRQQAYGRFESMYVDAGPVREHVTQLIEAGLSRRRIAELAGLNRKSMEYLLVGRKDRGHGPYKRITAENARKFLAVSMPPSLAAIAPDAAVVDATGTIRRVRALVAFGYTAEGLTVELAGQVSACTVHELVRGYRTQCLARVARSIKRLFDRLQLIPGTSQRSRNHAVKRRWALPFQWDEDTIDNPAAKPEPVRLPRSRSPKPQSPEVKSLRVQKVAELTRTNLSANEIATRLNISSRQVVRDRSALARTG
ncbi:hypothetical protein ASG84_25465 [Rhodococcus sp. Leaf278]|nr:hypothetical protein ASG84_25465 [Rhodococcus sp. Leaf278]